MNLNKRKFQEMIDKFTIGQAELSEIAAAFRYDIESGLKKSGESSLRMLESYVGLPTGKEKGEYLALDFGGTNVRVLRICLEGDKKFTICKKVTKPLRVPGIYDYVGEGSTAKDMFDFIAGIVDEAIDGNHTKKYLLGHTFSFPSKQTNLYNAKLISWTKEFATTGVEGQVVNDLLKAALERNGIKNVCPVAVINDTVAVLLAAAYKQEDTYIGSIYATGHNTCYLEPYADEGRSKMVINMESGAFCKLITNKYDHILDDASEKPGEQRLEKMVSGRYIGELFGYALADAFATDKKFVFTSIDMSGILVDQSETLAVVEKIVKDKTGEVLSLKECTWVKQLAAAVVIRSARLVAATYAGIIWHLSGNGKVCKQHIAVDGSVYEKMPLAVENIREALYDILGEDAGQVDTVLENGGSGLGAAIAAAIEPIA
jgi:hexokinase